MGGRGGQRQPSAGASRGSRRRRRACIRRRAGRAPCPRSTAAAVATASGENQSTLRSPRARAKRRRSRRPSSARRRRAGRASTPLRARARSGRGWVRAAPHLRSRRAPGRDQRLRCARQQRREPRAAIAQRSARRSSSPSHSRSQRISTRGCRRASRRRTLRATVRTMARRGCRGRTPLRRSRAMSPRELAERQRDLRATSSVQSRKSAAASRVSVPVRVASMRWPSQAGSTKSCTGVRAARDRRERELARERERVVGVAVFRFFLGVASPLNPTRGGSLWRCRHRSGLALERSVACVRT